MVDIRNPLMHIDEMNVLFTFCSRLLTNITYTIEPLTVQPKKVTKNITNPIK
jgi:hypothetical protein